MLNSAARAARSAAIRAASIAPFNAFSSACKDAIRWFSEAMVLFIFLSVAFLSS